MNAVKFKKLFLGILSRKNGILKQIPGFSFTPMEQSRPLSEPKLKSVLLDRHTWLPLVVGIPVGGEVFVGDLVGLPEEALSQK